MSEEANLSREEIEAFLKSLQKHLGTMLANRENVIDTVSQKARKQKGSYDFEAAFVEQFILNPLHDFLAKGERQNLNGSGPRQESSYRSCILGCSTRPPACPFEMPPVCMASGMVAATDFPKHPDVVLADKGVLNRAEVTERIKKLKSETRVNLRRPN